MDHSGDTSGSKKEMRSTNFPMHADLCYPSLDNKIAWLHKQYSEAATLSAQLQASGPPPNPSIATDAKPIHRA